MIIKNESRKQAKKVFRRIIAGFGGFTYHNKTSAYNGTVSVYIRENNDVIYFSNYFSDNVLRAVLKPEIEARIIKPENK